MEFEYDLNENANYQCHQCMRMNVQVTFLEKKCVNRKFGTRDKMNNLLVCYECHQYIGTDEKHPTWQMGWPSYFFSILTNSKFKLNETELAKFVSLIPKAIRDSYNSIVNEKGIQIVKNVWHNEPATNDLTRPLKEFERKILSGKPGDLVQALNETAYPNIRCGAGCCMHYEAIGIKEMEEAYNFVPFNHFLATFMPPQAISFEANRKKCRGFRPDFPNKLVVLEQIIVKPALYQHKKLGLVIICCSTNRHAIDKDIIHVPEHPILGSFSAPSLNYLSTLSIFPNIVRSGKSNQKTTSYDVLKLRGHSAGVSTFDLSLEQKSVELMDWTDVEYKAQALTLANRVDIKASALLRPEPYDRYSVEMAEKIDNLSQSELLKIEQAKVTGSYITEYDSLLLAKHAEDKYIQEEGHNPAVIKKPLFFIHPCNQHGAEPSDLPSFLCNKRATSSLDKVTYCILRVLQVNRALYYLFLKKSRNTNSLAYTKINNTLMGAHAQTGPAQYCTKKYISEVFKGIKDAMQNNPPDDMPSTNLLSEYLKQLLDRNIIDLNEGDNIADHLEAIEDIMCFNSTEVPQEDILMETVDQNVSLLSTITITENLMIINFRWNRKMSWWQIMPNNIYKKLQNYPHLDSPNILIYATEKAVACMEEKAVACIDLNEGDNIADHLFFGGNFQVNRAINNLAQSFTLPSIGSLAAPQVRTGPSEFAAEGKT